MPVLTLNQVRLVLRIALAHGQEPDRQRGSSSSASSAPASASAPQPASCSISSRSPAGSLKGGVAYGGTRAIGEAAVRYHEARASEPAA